VSAALQAIAAARQTLLLQYPRFREAVAERREASVLLAVLAVLLSAALLLARRFAPQRGVVLWAGANLLWFAALAAIAVLRLPS
jgi:hypothetical protein